MTNYRFSTASFRLAIATLLAALFSTAGAPAAVLDIVRDFGSVNGVIPAAAVIQGSDGNFYGATSTTIYQMSPAGVVTVLHRFPSYSSASSTSGGSSIQAPLVQGADGAFYGATVSGGTRGYGTVFRMTSAGEYTVLHHFAAPEDAGFNTEGGGCYGGLAFGIDGSLYGMTAFGGAGGTGTIFKITAAGVYSVVHQFSSLNKARTNADGAGPVCTLLRDSAGNFYGTTEAGGASGSGVIFELAANGKFTKLADFNVKGNSSQTPSGSLVQDNNGYIYGTTVQGGSSNQGTIFKYGPAGGLTTCASFDGSAGNYPRSGLIADFNGNFEGTTEGGGAGDNGVLFQVALPGGPTVLHSFSAADDYGRNPDGVSPKGVIQAADGNFYGVTQVGGPNGDGTLFRVLFIDPANIETLVAFSGDDSSPVATPTLGADGNLYGVTASGGVGQGTAYRIDADDTVTTIHVFNGLEGSACQDSLILATDGYFYGSSFSGGSADAGTLFRMAPDGTTTLLHSFSSLDGFNPGGIIQGSDDNIYGTTSFGGTHAKGIAFQFTAAGSFTSLHDFGAPEDSSAIPLGSLVEASPGVFYGTCRDGGPSDAGTIYQITSAGAVTKLFDFAGANGSHPSGALVRARDGNFYGTTFQGGANDAGTVFRFGPDGALTTLYSFSALGGPGFGEYANADGALPTCTLVEGPDGNLYGTTSEGGAGVDGVNGNGTVFQITPAGAVTTLGSLAGASGDAGQTAVVFARGVFYGVTAGGGALDGGTLYRVTMPPILTNGATANGSLGAAFSYQISSDFAADAFSAAGLPPGLSVDAASGLIAGAPTAAGTYQVTLGASNAAGAASGSLTVVIAKPVATIVATVPTVEAGGKFAAFEIDLSFPLPQDMYVSYVVKGTAANGVDYVRLTARKKIKAGQTSAKVKVRPLGDLGGAAKKVVKLMLVETEEYAIGDPAKAKVKLLARP